MQRLEVQAEIVMISAYCDIVLKILSTHRTLSINKMLVFAYLIKKKKFNQSDIYSTHNKHDVVLKCISQLSGLFGDYCENIQYLVKAIHILVSDGKVVVHETELLLPTDSQPIEYSENEFIKKAIEESKRYTDRQFLKEVIYNV